MSRVRNIRIAIPPRKRFSILCSCLLNTILDGGATILLYKNSFEKELRQVNKSFVHRQYHQNLKYIFKNNEMKCFYVFVEQFKYALSIIDSR